MTPSRCPKCGFSGMAGVYICGSKMIDGTLFQSPTCMVNVEDQEADDEVNDRQHARRFGGDEE